jgi:5-methylthioadenosine/S-adenosylhomocysteine deaminase
VEEDLLILANASVLACDPADSCGRRSLLLREGTIVEISDSAQELVGAAPSARLVDLTGKILLPGFVNAHFHTESVLLRDRTEGRLFRDWSADPLLRQVSRRLTDPGRRAVLSDLYRAGFAWHLKSGTTTASEFLPAVDGYGFEIVHRLAEKTGIRLAIILQNWDHVEYAKGKPDLLRSAALSLGSIQDLTVYTLDTRVQAARELGIPLAAHWGETSPEAEYFRKCFGKNLLELLKEHDALFPNTQLIHLNYCVPADFKVAQGVGATLTLCPRSAAEKGTGYPALRHLRSYRGALCLGSDWGGADMMMELRFLRQLPFLFPGMPRWSSLELLRMATIHGAGALGLAGETGSIEVGKRADVVVLTPDDVRAWGFPEGASAPVMADYIVQRLDSRFITDVLVGGKFRVREGALTDIDESELLQQLQRMRLEHYGAETAQHLAEAPRAVGEPRMQGKIIPLLSVSKSQSFEEVSEERPVAPAEVKGEPPPPEEKPVPQEPGRLIPELPKNVKRVFGEEEDL